jgi:hypothetical protein
MAASVLSAMCCDLPSFRKSYWPLHGKWRIEVCFCIGPHRIRGWYGTVPGSVSLEPPTLICFIIDQSESPAYYESLIATRQCGQLLRFKGQDAGVTRLPHFVQIKAEHQPMVRTSKRSQRVKGTSFF